MQVRRPAAQRALRLSSWLACGLCLAAAVGCQGTARPKWLQPGSADRQQAQAEVFDPYPQNNVGPDTVSTRPPGFEHEYPEVQRARPADQRSRFWQWVGPK